MKHSELSITLGEALGRSWLGGWQCPCATGFEKELRVKGRLQHCWAWNGPRAIWKVLKKES
jgi:hypothetical protein